MTYYCGNINSYKRFNQKVSIKRNHYLQKPNRTLLIDKKQVTIIGFKTMWPVSHNRGNKIMNFIDPGMIHRKLLFRIWKGVKNEF